MTKAERRALQEQKVQEKQNRMAAGLPGSAKKASEQEAHKKVGSPKIGSTSNSAQPIAPDAGKQAKKQQNKLNQVPWLSHLDPPKKPNTASNTNRELHPAVLALGLRFAEHKMVGSNARCVAMLTTFAKVIFMNHTNIVDRSFAITNRLPMHPSQDIFKSIWILILLTC
jgi:translation initiation factor eIF-2B subunit delta